MLTGPGPVIAIIDDDAAVRCSLKFSLELEGYSVATYESGAEMLAHVDCGSPGCLIVDQYMPGMTGIELIRRLREQSISIPAILITAKPSDDLRRLAKAAGVRQVIEKPLEGGALLDEIRSALVTAGDSGVPAH